MSNLSSRSTAQNLGPDLSYVVVIEKLITAIGQETNKKRILEAVLSYALTVSETEVGTLLVTGDTANSFRAVAKHGISKEVLRQLTIGDLGNFLLMGQRLWMKPQPTPSRQGQAMLGKHQLKYLFGLPLRFSGHVLGAIVVGSRNREYHSLTPVQQQRLHTIAQLVALFLDDLRLRTKTIASQTKDVANTGPPAESPVRMAEYEHDLEQLLAAVMTAEEEVANQNIDLGLLNNLSTKMSGTLQFNMVLDTAIKQTIAAMKADAGWCYLLQNQELVLCGQQGLSHNYVSRMQHLPSGNGAEGMAFMRREPILRDALLFHSGQMRRVVQDEGLMTIAAVPLCSKGEPFGVLAVANRSNRDWSERDHRMLVSIGQKVEQAVINSKMFTAVTEKATHLEDRYRALSQSNEALVRRTRALEQQIGALRDAEKQLWQALAASQQARRHSITPDKIDEQLITSLERALMTMQNKQSS